MSVTSDAGPLIALSKLRHFHLLSILYDDVLIPMPVYDEVVIRGAAAGHADATAVAQALAHSEIAVVDTRLDQLPPALSTLPLGQGEMHAIHLALQRGSDWLLVDDAQAREAASTFGLRVKGTLGILVQAFRTGVLAEAERDRVFQAILDRDDIWLDHTLVRRIWAELRRTD